MEGWRSWPAGRLRLSPASGVQPPSGRLAFYRQNEEGASAHLLHPFDGQGVEFPRCFVGNLPPHSGDGPPTGGPSPLISRTALCVG